MRPRTAPKRKQLSPAVSFVIIVAVVLVVAVVGYLYMRPKAGVTTEPPPMSAEVKKQRQSESAIWDEERKRAKAEGRLPDYSKLPRTGHPGAGGGMPDAPAGGQ